MPTLRRKVPKIDYKQILDDAWQLHLAPREPNAPTVISTFAGGGGSSLGYSMAGYNELLAVEWDNNAVETLRLNFPGLKIYYGDIAKLSVEQCLEMAGLKPGELDILDGSPPCQGFSTAGKRNLDDDRNQLFREYVRLLRGLKPKVFVMENVSGMVKGKMKLIFAEIMRELKASGYQVSARLMNAMYFNVPQSRQRMIFIGTRDDLGVGASHPRAKSSTNSGRELLPEDWRDLRFLSWRNAGGDDELRPINMPPVAISKKGIDFEGRRVFTQSNIVQLFQSFPACFRFEGENIRHCERIGNSVPPLFMKAIAEHIRTDILAKPNLISQ